MQVFVHDKYFRSSHILVSKAGAQLREEAAPDTRGYVHDLLTYITQNWKGL